VKTNFKNNFAMAEKNLTEEQKKSDAWKGIREYSLVFLNLMEIENRLTEAYGNNFFSALDRELEDGQGKNISPSSPVSLYVNYMNRVHGSHYSPKDIKSKADLISMVENIYKNYLTSVQK
jgi:hypothetical protein